MARSAQVRVDYPDAEDWLAHAISVLERWETVKGTELALVIREGISTLGDAMPADWREAHRERLEEIGIG